MVQESSGPVAGLVSQNWVWRRRPPGELKQHESLIAVVLWQLSWVVLREQAWRLASAPPARRSWDASAAIVDLERVDDGGIVGVFVGVWEV